MNRKTHQQSKNTFPSSRQGVTLVEMMLVIAIVAVLLAIVPAFRDPDNGLKEAQRVFTQATDRARGLVRRFNIDYRLDITNGGNSFRYYPVDQSNIAVSGLTEISRKLPDGIVLAGATNVDLTQPIFLGPFARTREGASEQCFRISSASRQAGVSLIGVTGKVIPRGLTTTACQ
jgi:prepilin-type N-terminal cleavage/methylation domain-containing protein